MFCLADKQIVHKPFADEGEERYFIMVPPQSRDGKSIDVPHVPRTVLWDKYVNFLRQQIQSFLKIAGCLIAIIVLLPFPGINFLSILFAALIGYEIKHFVIQQEFKTINFSRHNIPYPFFEG